MAACGSFQDSPLLLAVPLLRNALLDDVGADAAVFRTYALLDNGSLVHCLDGAQEGKLDEGRRLFGEFSRQALVVGELGQALLVGGDGIVVPLEGVEGGTLAGVALGEVGIETDARFGILQRVVRIALLEVGGRSVAEVAGKCLKKVSLKDKTLI